MDSDGRLFKKGELKAPSRLLRSYYELEKTGFDDLKRFDAVALDRLLRIHDKHLDFYREERRMHFGAFALVGLATIIVLPAVLILDAYFLPLASILVLLLCLLVPYTFVYFKYEQGVRRKMKESMILENERALRNEKN